MNTEITYKQAEFHEKCDEIMRQIINGRKYFYSHELLDYFIEQVEKKTFKKDSFFFRARANDGNLGEYSAFKLGNVGISTIPYGCRFNELNDDQKKHNMEIEKNKEILSNISRGFYGYDINGCSVPPKHIYIEKGRANSEYVRNLYLANNKETAVHEIKPTLNAYVNVARFTNKSELSVVDLTIDKFNKFDTLEDYFCFYIAWMFTKPIEDDTRIYTFTDFITQLIEFKIKKIDGIAYSSSMNPGGICYSIFKYEDCIPKDSRVYKIKGHRYSFEEIPIC